jgi:hypothetical protein
MFVACPSVPRVSKLFEWRITRIRATPARLIGYVKAPDAEQAVKEAIARYGIDNPQGPRRWGFTLTATRKFAFAPI